MKRFNLEYFQNFAALLRNCPALWTQLKNLAFFSLKENKVFQRFHTVFFLFILQDLPVNVSPLSFLSTVVISSVTVCLAL